MNIIKNIFRFLGFSISRVHNMPKDAANPTAKPLFIEFIGVSGVGKTTLYKEVKRVRASAKWIERFEFLRFQPKINIDQHMNSKMLQMLEKKSFKIWNSEINLNDKIKLLSFVYQNISEEVSALLHNKNATLINEDGLFHNFGKEIKDLYNDDPTFFHELCENRAIVYCTNNAENIAKNIQKRNMDFKAIRPHHRLNSLEQLIEIQSPLLQETASFVKILQANSVPVLSINTDDDISENARKVNLFIMELQRST